MPLTPQCLEQRGLNAEVICVIGVQYHLCSTFKEVSQKEADINLSGLLSHSLLQLASSNSLTFSGKVRKRVGRATVGILGPGASYHLLFGPQGSIGTQTEVTCRASRKHPGCSALHSELFLDWISAGYAHPKDKPKHAS